MDAQDKLDVETLGRLARLAGFTLTDAELEALRPAVEAGLRMLAALQTLPLDAAEPATQYRVI